MRKANHFGNSCNSCTRSLGLIVTPFICISGWIYQSAIGAQPVCARATCVRGLSVQAIKAPLIVFLTPLCAAPSSSPVTAGAYSSTSRLTPRHPATATRTEHARTRASRDVRIGRSRGSPALRFCLAWRIIIFYREEMSSCRPEVAEDSAAAPSLRVLSRHPAHSAARRGGKVFHHLSDLPSTD